MVEKGDDVLETVEEEALFLVAIVTVVVALLVILPTFCGVRKTVAKED